MKLISASSQDVFEVRFAKMPDEPLTPEDDDDDDDTKDSDASSHPTTPSGSESDDSEVEREEQLTKLQAQVSATIQGPLMVSSMN